MNLMGKICGSSGEEKQQIDQHPPTVIAPFFSSSSSSAAYHYHHHHRHQQQPIVSPPPSHHHSGRWPLDRIGEPSLNHDEELAEAGGGSTMIVEREHMFDKVVTPSDVGKLNRLVIPKQHAERYFPLDTSTNDKGLLLNFEDRNGKLWRFRYSYWNSSQSYVMTKGWSRFVKDKKLDAGDIVSFQRGVGITAKDRLFIDWRRRVSPPHNLLSSPSSNLSNFPFYNHNFIHPWKPLVLQSLPARKNPNLMLPSTNSNPSNSRSVFLAPQLQEVQRVQYRSEFGFGFDPQLSPTPPVHDGKASGKRLRLFGVNMDCVVFSEDDGQHYFQPSTISPLIPSSSTSSSLSTIPYLQLTPANYGGGTDQCSQSTLLSSSSANYYDFNITAKPTASNMSLDLKM